MSNSIPFAEPPSEEGMEALRQGDSSEVEELLQNEARLASALEEVRRELRWVRCTESEGGCLPGRDSVQRSRRATRCNELGPGGVRLARCLLLALVIGVPFYVTGCDVLYVPREVPSGATSLEIDVWPDASRSHGMDASGERVSPAEDAFDVAREQLSALLREVVLRPGDRLVGVTPFTDEAVEDLLNRNLIASGEILVDSADLPGSHAHVEEVLSLLRLRDTQDSHRTYYRNALDAALRRFNLLSVPAERSLVLLLTDEMGSEAGSALETPPEQYPHLPVLKLVAPARGGPLRAVPNELLVEMAGGEADLGVSAYVAALREKYARTHPRIQRVLSVPRVAGTLVAILVILGATLLAYRRRASRHRNPEISSAHYSPADRAIVIVFRNLESPENPEDYLIDGGAVRAGRVVRRGPDRVHVHPEEDLPPGPHTVEIRTSLGPHATELKVPEPVRAAAYQVTVTRWGDLDHPWSQVLEARETDVLDGTGLPAALHVRRDGSWLLLRGRGRIRSSAGGELTMERHALDEVVGRALVFDLEDGTDAIELQVVRT